MRHTDDEFDEVRSELAQRRRQLASQPVIEQAKGMLMLLHDLDDEGAFALLREVSQLSNTKLHEVAAIVLSAGSDSLPGPGRDASTAAVLGTLESLTRPDGVEPG
ncbi:ANTAR domain-containing protein [Amycolatopsis nigrescens]|uniref:ANTAR domain-containing protein n=1 Tax=Amycolatopsis nigrescens TaxID=381445 RepID=UPI000366053F|nr:ANTAR domain-containing protein [Amycolatopsis nigrescens]